MNKNFSRRDKGEALFPAINGRTPLSAQELAAALIGVLGPLAQISSMSDSLIKEGGSPEFWPF